MASLFIEIGVVIIVAGVFAAIARFLKQPLIIGYMLAGIVIGPIGFGLITDIESIITLSEIGIAFLLFMVGTELDFRKVKNLGMPALFTGLGQIIFTFVAGYFIAGAFGFGPIASLYISLALTLSSTVIVIKMLSDKKALNTLHGRLALGILIVQDIVAIIAIALLSVETFTLSIVMASLFKGLLLFVLILGLGSIILRLLFHYFAKSQELLFIGGVSWLFLSAILANSLGYSIAIGAFLAGLSMTTLPYHIEIIGKVRSLRDFFAVIFFVSLGMVITFNGTGGIIWPVIIFSLFVLIGNPIISTIIMVLSGFKVKTAFLTGLSIAQISEFSLILVTLGFTQGVIPQSILTIIALIAIITFTVNSYFITYGSQIYSFFAPVLKPLDKLRKHKIDPELNIHEHFPEILIAGTNRIGGKILESAQEVGMDVLTIDYDPDVCERLTEKKIPCIYGDISDTETLDHINLKKLKLVVSTTAGLRDQEILVRYIKRKKKSIKVILTAEHIPDALDLYENGADYVILPHMIGGEHIGYLLQDATGIKDIHKKRRRHIKELRRHGYKRR